MLTVVLSTALLVLESASSKSTFFSMTSVFANAAVADAAGCDFEPALKVLVICKLSYYLNIITS